MGKKQFSNMKNINSQEFSLKELKTHANSPICIPTTKPKRSILRHYSPDKNLEISPFPPSSRLAKIEEIRKNINLKIIGPHSVQPLISDIPSTIFTPPPIKKMCPEKFVESITFTKADLMCHSKFIPTERNTNKYLADPNNQKLFPNIYLTKRSPKTLRASPILGY
jgi:hypothetical protein